MSLQGFWYAGEGLEDVSTSAVSMIDNSICTPVTAQDVHDYLQADTKEQLRS